MQRQEMNGARIARLSSALTLTIAAVLGSSSTRAEQPPPPCHPNPTAAADEAAVRGRGDIAKVPGELQDRLAQLANRPHTYLPLQVFNEADGASQLFQYYLLDTSGFEPNVFTAIIPGGPRRLPGRRDWQAAVDCSRPGTERRGEQTPGGR